MEKTVSIYFVSINMAGLGNTYDKALEDDCSVNASPLNENKTQKNSPLAVACTSCQFKSISYFTVHLTQI